MQTESHRTNTIDKEKRQSQVLARTQNKLSSHSNKTHKRYSHIHTVRLVATYYLTQHPSPVPTILLGHCRENDVNIHRTLFHGLKLKAI